MSATSTHPADRSITGDAKESVFNCGFCDGPMVVLGGITRCEDCGLPAGSAPPAPGATISEEGDIDATGQEKAARPMPADPQSSFGRPVNPPIEPTPDGPTPGDPEPDSVSLASPPGEGTPAREMKRKK